MYRHVSNWYYSYSRTNSADTVDSVDVLFDDGVEYTAPLRSVRKRVSSYTLYHNLKSTALYFLHDRG